MNRGFAAFGVAVVIAAAAVSVALYLVSSSRDAQTVSVHIYDPSGHTTREVTVEEVVRASARAARDPSGAAYLAFDVTPKGVRIMRQLTRDLAHRGILSQRPQHMAIAVNGHIISDPELDYHAFPNGLQGGSPSVQVYGVTFSSAQRLARAIRHGSPQSRRRLG